VCTVLEHFFNIIITLKVGGRRWGKEGFLLAKYHAEFLLIGCILKGEVG
jgi:hypothetical protein